MSRPAPFPRLRAPPRRAARCIALLALCAACLVPAPSRAQDENALERSVKAAYLYRFLGYIEWPPAIFSSRESPLVLGVLGSDAMAQELAQLVAKRSVEGRPVMVRTLKEGDRLAGLHVVFVARADASRLPQVARLLAGPVLIVSEADGALAQGSVINFVVSGGKVRFEVALDHAERRGLRLSSRMLAVALQVQGSSP